MTYASPYGSPVGLRARLVKHRAALGAKHHPWLGLGLVADLDLIMQFLDKHEWLEAMRTGSDPKLAEFATDLQRDQETLDAAYDAAEHARALPTDVDTLDPVAVIEHLDAEADKHEAFGRRVRDTLEQLGIVDADTPDEDIPALLTALLA